MLLPDDLKSGNRDKGTEMARYSTIYCSKPDYVGVAERIRGMSGTVSVHGPENGWSKIVCQGREMTITFNSMRKKKPGDEFSKLILSTHNFFRTRVKQQSESKDAVLSRIKRTALVIGVVAEPDLSDEGKACLLDLARLLDGVIFNGSSMINAEGQLIVGVS